MATASASHNHRTLTPPTSSHGGRGSWDFAVPLNGENESYHETAYHDNDTAIKHSSGAYRQPLSTQTNGTSRSQQRWGDAREAQRGNGRHQEPYLAKPATLRRKASELSAGGSESDSLLDLYKPNGDGKSGTTKPETDGRRKMSVTTTTHTEELDASNWIHRDKLAKIESRELQEAGIRLGRSSRSASRSASVSGQRRDRQGDHDVELARGVEEGLRDQSRHREDKRKKKPTPVPAGDEPEGTMYPTLQRPAEFTTEQDSHGLVSQQQPARSTGLRPGTSRIPVAKTSPVPVPSTVIERDQPLPRSRHGSNAWSGDFGLEAMATRPRSRSVGSQILLDDGENAGETTPPNRNSTSEATSPPLSPPKARVPSKATPSSGGRKVTGPRAVSGQKPRVASGLKDSPNKRPRTSSGTPTRPSTSHNRPEGEAPWIPTMYKPDPRLPPDQQMLPTHAKRLAQEKWEREGKTGSIYDKEFRLLSADEFPKPLEKSPTPELETSKAEDKPQPHEDGQWPLATPVSRTDSPKPGSTQHGGYKTTPTIPQGQFLAPTTSQQQKTEIEPRPKQPIRVQDPPESKKEKSCGCCIVM